MFIRLEMVTNPSPESVWQIVWMWWTFKMLSLPIPRSDRLTKIPPRKRSAKVWEVTRGRRVTSMQPKASLSTLIFMTPPSRPHWVTIVCTAGLTGERQCLRKRTLLSVCSFLTTTRERKNNRKLLEKCFVDGFVLLEHLSLMTSVTFEEKKRKILHSSLRTVIHCWNTVVGVSWFESVLLHPGEINSVLIYPKNLPSRKRTPLKSSYEIVKCNVFYQNQSHRVRFEEFWLAKT